MFDFESLKTEYKAIYPTWNEQQIEDYARLMSEKYSTIKTGSNVVHLEYYGGLLSDLDIIEIESNLSDAGLVLSRFDKTGVPYASLRDFSLDVALFLSNPIVSDIIIAIGASALYDSIKASAFLIWKQIKERYWSKLPDHDKSKNKINFGLHVRLDDNTNFDLKLDSGLSEKNALNALDKIIDLIKLTKSNEKPTRAKFYQTDKKGNWTEVDIQNELRKQIKLQNKKSRKK